MAGIISAFCTRVPMTLSRNVRNSHMKGVSLMTIRKISFWRKKSDTAVAEPVKSEYEIEYEKFAKKDNWKPTFGIIKGDPVYDNACGHMILFMGLSLTLVFVPIMMMYGPDYRNKMKVWRRYEAIKLIEEREAKGEMLLDMNFVPIDQIAAMVPPAGDWEEEWLRNQPAVRSKTRSYYYVQAPTW